MAAPKLDDSPAAGHHRHAPAMFEALIETQGERSAHPGKTRIAEAFYGHARIPAKCASTKVPGDNAADPGKLRRVMGFQQPVLFIPVLRAERPVGSALPLLPAPEAGRTLLGMELQGVGLVADQERLVREDLAGGEMHGARRQGECMI